jgi:hypothetical protein
MDNFIAGIAYGVTTVIVGQPLDTIKTRMQAMGGITNLNSINMIDTARDLVKREGIPGLYRGGSSLLVGGALIRSAQFGVYNFVFQNGEKYLRTNAENRRILKFIDPLVVFAGFAGGMGRGLVEAPFEFIKTRIQVQHEWSFKEIFSGSTATMVRNSLLFSSFVIYIDISKQMIQGGLGPFLTGAICSNLAWLTIWPLDVVKSQVQSGNYEGKSIARLLTDNIKNGTIYRGLLPGLTRSFIANGCSMVVYEWVLRRLTERRNSQSN